MGGPEQARHVVASARCLCPRDASLDVCLLRAVVCLSVDIQQAAEVIVAVTPSDTALSTVLPDFIRDLIQEERRFAYERQNQQTARRTAIKELVIRYAKKLPQ